MTSSREPVARALDILTWLGNHPPVQWHIRQVARDLDTSPSTVHRIFQVYEARGFLQRSEEGGYRPSLDMYRVCQSIVRHNSSIVLARPHLEHLADETGETALLGSYDPHRYAMMFLDSVPSPHLVRYVISLNEWVPIHSGGTGLAILAALPDNDRRQVYKRGLYALTNSTLTSKAQLEQAVQDIKRIGYACTHGQRTDGAVGIAAPILDADQHVYGSLSVTLPEQRFEPESIGVLGSLVMAGAEMITKELVRAGYRHGSMG